MERKTIVLALLAMMATTQIKAQSDDFGMWYEVTLDKKINKSLSADLTLEHRSRDSHRETDRWSGDLGIEYKLMDWLKVSAGYAFLYDNNEKWNEKHTKVAKYWGERHRFNAGLTASCDVGDLSISLRERWQYTYRPEKTVDRERVSDGAIDEKTYNGKGKNIWRNRLQLKYKLTKTWRPYANGESFVGGAGLDKLRFAVGTEIRMSKRHSFDVKYIFQKACDDDDEEGNRHVIGFGYTYKF